MGSPWSSQHLVPPYCFVLPALGCEANGERYESQYKVYNDIIAEHDAPVSSMDIKALSAAPAHLSLNVKHVTGLLKVRHPNAILSGSKVRLHSPDPSVLAPLESAQGP